MADLLCVDPVRVAQVWPLVQPILQRATARTGLSDFICIERDVLAGRSLLWLAVREESGAAIIDAAAVTRLERSDHDLVCMLTACAGRGLRTWLPLLARLEAYARDEGCSRMRLMGRRGWLRVLRDYRQSSVILEKRLA